MLFPANRFDVYRSATLIDIIKDSMGANSHFPRGKIVGPKRLAIPCLDQGLRRQLLFDDVENNVLIGLLQER
jgi:hypothetical protein